MERERKKKDEREKEEGNRDNEDRVRHVPEALPVSLSGGEPTASGLLPLPGRMQTRVQMPLTHVRAAFVKKAGAGGGGVSGNKEKRNVSQMSYCLASGFFLTLLRGQS